MRAQAPAVGEAIRRVGAEAIRIKRRIAELRATPPGSVDKEGGTDLEPVRAQGPSVSEPQDAIREAAVELRRASPPRLWPFAAQALSDAELIAVLLRGRPDTSALEMAREIIAEGSGHACLSLAGLTRLRAAEEIIRGTSSRVAVEFRQILRLALQHNASEFIVFHNHPSGKLRIPTNLTTHSDGIRPPIPTESDHLVVGRGRWVSIQKEEGAVDGKS